MAVRVQEKNGVTDTRPANLLVAMDVVLAEARPEDGCKATLRSDMQDPAIAGQQTLSFRKAKTRRWRSSEWQFSQTMPLRTKIDFSVRRVSTKVP
ncbi:hypothetical protein P6U16_23100 (plasmid) [Rhizobium sp. 32-5/1]|uniref:hypothetical protein n=1 Tax=Rhizobium sp. 32-5/1 TaxID=3019602 RepID=UPI00240DE1FE|nr:hypothetical protein [Rhizobium sp. 32-5/1]WEZ85881.1 hypothetical protein P6U16_23100 [Rhizobium sp. 32-5/1]